jgi:hypothetical protein
MTRRVLLPALCVGAFFLCLYLLTGSSDLQHNGDTVLRYQTAQSIVEDGHIWVAHPAWKDSRMAQGVGGHLYAFYAPGQPVFMVPLYVLGKGIATQFHLPPEVTTLYSTRSLDLVLGAVLAVAFFLLAVSVGYSIRTCALLTLVFGLATSAWPDAQSSLEQTQVDLFLLLAVLCIWCFARGGLSNRWWLLAGGAAAGLAVFTRYDAAIYIPILALFPALVRAAARLPLRPVIRDWFAFLSGLVPWLLLVGWWDWIRFGSPLLTGLHERTFGEPFVTGVLGLTISPGKGLVWYVPIVLLLPWAAPRFAARQPALAALCVAMVLLPLLFYANVLYWHGDPAWGPRYLYTALPYLVLPLGEMLQRWRLTGTGLRAAVVVLVLASLGVQLAAISVTQWRSWYRLEVMQQQTASAAHWTGQPFHWGAMRYHYYWNPRQAPIFMQVDDVYQVVRIMTGDRHYLFTGKPDPYVSNPALNYPINSLSFWWLDARHPLFGNHVRWALALLLALGGVLALVALWKTTAPHRVSRSRSSRLEIAAAG